MQTWYKKAQASAQYVSPYHELAYKDYVEYIGSIAEEILDPRALYIFQSYFGLNGKKQQKYQEIAKTLKRDPSRIRDILIQSLSKIRRRIGCDKKEDQVPSSRKTSEGEPYEWRGHTYQGSPTYENVFTNMMDSLVGSQGNL